MTSLPPAACCLKGVLHEGETTGEDLKVEEVDCYITYPKYRSTALAILLFTDIIGHKLHNSRLVADQFAANGYFVVMPDLFQGDPVPLNRPETYDLMKWLKGPPGHLQDSVDPIVAKIFNAMRGTFGCRNIGGVGYCFGAKYVVRNLKAGLLDVGYICTPSLVEAIELRQVTGPLSIAAAEIDTVFPQDKRIESENILRDELSVPYQINLYGHVEHGFGCKADIKIPENKFAKEQAFLQAIFWFDEHLRPGVTN